MPPKRAVKAAASVARIERSEIRGSQSIRIDGAGIGDRLAAGFLPGKFWWIDRKVVSGQSERMTAHTFVMTRYSGRAESRRSSKRTLASGSEPTYVPRTP